MYYKISDSYDALMTIPDLDCYVKQWDLYPHNIILQKIEYLLNIIMDGIKFDFTAKLTGGIKTISYHTLIIPLYLLFYYHYQQAIPILLLFFHFSSSGLSQTE